MGNDSSPWMDGYNQAKDEDAVELMRWQEKITPAAAAYIKEQDLKIGQLEASRKNTLDEVRRRVEDERVEYRSAWGFQVAVLAIIDAVKEEE